MSDDAYEMPADSLDRSRLRYVGKSLARREDPDLVAGRGRYLEDEITDGVLHLHFIRSPYARATIQAVDIDAARSMQGVVEIVTGADPRLNAVSVPITWRSPGLLMPEYPALAGDSVSHVGQPIVAILADSRAEAEDAAAFVDITFREEEPVVSVAEALDGDILVHPQLGTNVAYDVEIGAGDVERAFAEAAVVVEGRFVTPRQTGVPMQRRGCIASYEMRSRQLQLQATVHAPHMLREHVASELGFAIEDVRVFVGDLGGAFGIYTEVYPEYLVAAALAVGRSERVAWVEDRLEGFLTTVHGRAQGHHASLALATDGRILGFRSDIVGDAGAYLGNSGAGPGILASVSTTGPYVVPSARVRLRWVFTNQVRVGAYRGFGQPEAVFALERLMDRAASELSLDPIEIRRRNVVRTFPYKAPVGPELDSGDFPRLLDMIETIRDAGPRASDPASGWVRGSGLAIYVEMTGTGPSRHMHTRGYMAAGWEAATIEVTSTGHLRVFSGASHLGQGIRTALAQICAEHFDMSIDRIDVVTGDTALVRNGSRASGGSRSAVIAGQATWNAASALRDRVQRVASHLLEAHSDDLLVSDGYVAVAGMPDRRISFADLFREAHLRHSLPPDEDASLVETRFWEPDGLSYASGVHLAWVDVNTDTGFTKLVDYAIVHDCGLVVNPAIVEGQIRGGTAQGIGSALFETLVYDDRGQLSSGTLMDYLLPLATDLVDMRISHLESPAPHVPFGAKGCGEAGTIAPPAAIGNAIAMALGDNVDFDQLPITPERIWRAIERAKKVSA